MKRIYLCIIFFIFIAPPTFASGDGGYAGAFLRMGLSARAKAMGDAFTAMPMGAVSAIYNPALLPHLQHRHALLSSALLPLDRRLDFVGYAQPLQPKVHGDEDEGVPIKAGFSLAWVHAGVNNIDGRDLSGNHTGYFSYSEHAFYLSFSLSPLEFFSIGLSGKILYNRFPNMTLEDKALTSSGFGLDFGACLRPTSDLTIGLAVRDQMSKYTWNTDKVWERGTSSTDKFPTVTRVGISYRLPNRIFIIAADIEDCKEQDPRYHIGAEASLPEIGALRLGVDNGMLAAGFSVIIPRTKQALKLSYAFWNEVNQAGFAHIFDLAISFPFDH